MTRIVGDIDVLGILGRSKGNMGFSSADTSRGQGMYYPAPERKGHFELKRYLGQNETMIGSPDRALVLADSEPNPLIFTVKRPFVDFEWILKVKAGKECVNKGTFDLLFRELSPVDDRTKAWIEFNAPILDVQGNITTQGDSIPAVQVDKIYLLRAKTPDEEKWDYWMYHGNNNPKLGVVNSGRTAMTHGEVIPVQAHRQKVSKTRYFSKNISEEMAEYALISVPPNTAVTVRITGDSNVRVEDGNRNTFFTRIKTVSTKDEVGSNTYNISESPYARVFMHEVESNIIEKQPFSDVVLFGENTSFRIGVWKLNTYLVGEIIEAKVTMLLNDALWSAIGGTFMPNNVHLAIGGDIANGRVVFIESISHPTRPFEMTIKNESPFTYAIEWPDPDRNLFLNINGPLEVIEPGKSATIKAAHVRVHKIFDVTISIDSVASSVDSPPKPVYIYRNLQYNYF